MSMIKPLIAITVIASLCLHASSASAAFITEPADSAVNIVGGGDSDATRQVGKNNQGGGGNTVESIFEYDISGAAAEFGPAGATATLEFYVDNLTNSGVTIVNVYGVEGSDDGTADGNDSNSSNVYTLLGAFEGISTGTKIISGTALNTFINSQDPSVDEDNYVAILLAASTPETLSKNQKIEVNGSSTSDSTTYNYSKLTITAVPEPASLTLLCTGGLLMVGHRWGRE